MLRTNPRAGTLLLPARAPKGPWRINDEHAILVVVPIRTCTVSFTDGEGIRHSVNVQAATLYEPAALAVRTFREHGFPPGPASNIDVESRESQGEAHRQHAEDSGAAGIVGEKPRRQSEEGSAEGIAGILRGMAGWREGSGHALNASKAHCFSKHLDLIDPDVLFDSPMPDSPGTLS